MVLSSLRRHFNDFSKDHLHLWVIVRSINTLIILIIFVHEPVVHLEQRKEDVCVLLWVIKLKGTPLVCEYLVLTEILDVIRLVKANRHYVEVF